MRLGWDGYHPFLKLTKRNPIKIYQEAIKAGCKNDDEVKKWVVEQFKEKKLDFALHDIDAPENRLKMLTVYRGNLIGCSMRGSELTLKHFLGTHNNVMWDEEPDKR